MRVKTEVAANSSDVNNHAEMTTQFFETVTRKSHPAASYVFDFLESLVSKDIDAFAAAFGARMPVPLFANLPGSVKVYDVHKFIEMHREFFNSSTSRFEYGQLNNGIGGEDFFLCSVPANVTLPNGTKRTVCIDMTLFKGSEKWIPCRFINTVVDAAQTVLKE